jgi:hypothetical protein
MRNSSIDWFGQFFYRYDTILVFLQICQVINSEFNIQKTGFNSINAYASVNQLHLHAYYLDSKLKRKDRPLPIQNIHVN